MVYPWLNLPFSSLLISRLADLCNLFYDCIVSQDGLEMIRRRGRSQSIYHIVEKDADIEEDEDIDIQESSEK